MYRDIENCSISSTPARWHCSYKGLDIPLDCAPRAPLNGGTLGRIVPTALIYQAGPSTTTGVSFDSHVQ